MFFLAGGSIVRRTVGANLPLCGPSGDFLVLALGLRGLGSGMRLATVRLLSLRPLSGDRGHAPLDSLADRHHALRCPGGVDSREPTTEHLARDLVDMRLCGRRALRPTWPGIGRWDRPGHR